MTAIRSASALLPLTEAAQRIRLGYHAARDLLLKGQLEGEKRDGRWFVDAKSLEAFDKEIE